LIDIARDVGICGTCIGNGDLRQGFRAEVRGMVTVLANGDIPPTIAVTGVVYSNAMDTVCDGSETLAPSMTGGSSGAGGGDSSNPDKPGNQGDENDAAITVVSTISVVCIALVALLSMFKGAFQKK
jgi:hypothetical protein